MIEESGRILHTHTEEAQSFTGLKPEKTDSDEIMMFENKNDPEAEIKEAPIIRKHHPKPVDVSKLPVVRISLSLIKDAMRHKVTM